jgi:hypothetical protein
MDCHFFTPDEIEFSFYTREVVGQPQFEAVCEFMRLVGRTLAKPVVVSYESAPSYAFLRYDPETDEVVPLQPEELY